jgi:hypothetical protein
LAGIEAKRGMSFWLEWERESIFVGMVWKFAEERWLTPVCYTEMTNGATGKEDNVIATSLSSGEATVALRIRLFRTSDASPLSSRSGADAVNETTAEDRCRGAPVVPRMPVVTGEQDRESRSHEDAPVLVGTWSAP